MKSIKTAIGNIEWKSSDNKTCTGWITEVVEDCDGDYFCRYQTDAMLGFMEPLVKISTTKNLIYFLTERSANGLITFQEYERRGYKCKLHLY